jgi:sulfatase modifying factor 1
MLSRLAIGFILVTLTLTGQEPPLPEFVPIPAGEFSMGSAEGAAWERPPHAVETPGFEISARPVSSLEFRAFRPGHRSPGDEGPDAPVTGVTWSDAEAYCRWLQDRLGTGVALPSEARWERAARGGLDQQTYPWGAEYTPAASSSSALTSKPNGFGVYAVAYNLWEWTADWYAPDYFSESSKEDPAGPVSGDFRVLRGGGFRSDPASATCYSRGKGRRRRIADTLRYDGEAGLSRLRHGIAGSLGHRPGRGSSTNFHRVRLCARRSRRREADPLLAVPA